MSDLVDRISTAERSLQGSPSTESDPTRRSLTPPRHALMASAPYTLSLTTPSSLAMERSKTAKSLPNSRMKEMLSQLDKVQEEAVKLQNVMVKSLENRIVENTRSQEVSLRTKIFSMTFLRKKYLLTIF